MSTDASTAAYKSSDLLIAAGEDAKSIDSVEQLLATQRQQQKSVDDGMTQLRSELSLSPSAPKSSDWPLVQIGLGVFVVVAVLLFGWLRWGGRKYAPMRSAANSMPPRIPAAPDLLIEPDPSAQMTSSENTDAMGLELPKPQTNNPAPVTAQTENAVDTEQALLDMQSSWMGDVSHQVAHIDLEAITSWDAPLQMAKEYEKMGHWEEAVNIYEQAMQRGDAATREQARKSLMTLMPGA